MAQTSSMDVEVITKVVLQSEELTASARQMILEGLPHATSWSGERHEFQLRFLGIAHRTVQHLSTVSGEKQLACEMAVESARAGASEAKAAGEEAQRAEQAASAVVEEKARLLAEQQEAARKTKEQLADADGEKARVVKSWDELEGERAEVSFLLEGPLRMLLSGGWEDTDARDGAIDAVQTYLTSAQAEPALLAAVPVAFRFRPESRNSFDKFTASAVEELVKEKAADIAARIEAARPQVDEISDEALGLWALSDREDEAERAAKAALTAANASLTSARVAAVQAADELGQRDAAVGAKLAAQAREQEWGAEVAKALEASERLASFSYPTETQAMDVEEAGAADAAVAEEAAGTPADAEMEGVQAKGKAPVSARGVPTPTRAVSAA